MKKTSLRILLALAIGSITTPALARNWVALDPWIFFDRDSVTRSGDSVTFAVAHNDGEEYVPPRQDAAVNYQTLNCSSLQISRVFDGKTETWSTSTDSSDYVALCR